MVVRGARVHEPETSSNACECVSSDFGLFLVGFCLGLTDLSRYDKIQTLQGYGRDDGNSLLTVATG